MRVKELKTVYKVTIVINKKDLNWSVASLLLNRAFDTIRNRIKQRGGDI